MDHEEYTTLVATLRSVPDPRKARGQRYPWELLLTLIASRTGERSASGCMNTQMSVAMSWPSRRALQTVDVVALDAGIGALWPTDDRPAAGLVGVAIDGKVVRGVRAHGRVVHLLSLDRYDGRVLAQAAVADKANEITAAPGLLADQPLQVGSSPWMRS